MIIIHKNNNSYFYISVIDRTKHYTLLLFGKIYKVFIPTNICTFLLHGANIFVTSMDY